MVSAQNHTQYTRNILIFKMFCGQCGCGGDELIERIMLLCAAPEFNQFNVVVGIPFVYFK